MNTIIKHFNKYLALAVLLFWSVSAIAGRPHVEKRKVFNKTYSLSGVTLFSLNNQFGEVRIIDHNSNEARVEAEIIVDTKSEETSQQMLDAIKIVEKTGSTLSIKTEIEGRVNNNKGKSSMKINYKVWLPSTMAIDLVNQFGHLYLPAWQGKSKLVVKFGRLETAAIANNEEARVEFGEMKLGEVTNGKIVGQYSEVEVDGLNGTIRGDFDFCKNPTMTIGSNFENGNITNSYSQIKLNVPAGYKGKFDIRTSFSELKNNSAFYIKEDREEDERGPRFDKDYYGQAGTGPAMLKVKTSFGNITIK